MTTQLREPPTTGEAISIEGLVREYHQDVYGYAYRLCGKQVDAEDFTQQTFLIAQRKIDQLRDPHKAKAWLRSIARSCFLKSLRKRQPVLGEIEFNEVPHEIPDREDIDLEQLQSALERLPEMSRLMLVLFYYDDYSYKQISQELDIPLGTVMSRLSRAKDALRRELTAES